MPDTDLDRLSGMVVRAGTQRRTGRPDAKATLDLDRRVLDSAIKVFRQQGFAGASMEQVALEAGTGKQTIYRRYTSKEDLFTAVVAELCSMFIEIATLRETRAPTDPLSVLRETCRATLEFVSRAEVVAIYRVLIAEGARFPVLIKKMLMVGGEPYHKHLRNLLQAAQNAGQIRPDLDTEATTRILSGMMTGWSLQRSLLFDEGLKDKASRTVFFDRAWEILLRGVSHGRKQAAKSRV